MAPQNETRRAGGAAGLVDCHRRLASDNRVSPQNPSLIKNNLARGSGASVSSNAFIGSARRRCFTY
jgi:hypothetical protein